MRTLTSKPDASRGLDKVLSADDYNVVFHLWPDMFFLADSAGIILEVNPACERILGYSREEFVGKSWETYAHPEDVEKTRREVERQINGQQVLNFVNRYRRKSGEYLFLEWQGIFTDSQCLVGIGRNITDEVRRSELLAKVAQNERKSLCAALHDGISQQLFGIRMIANQLRKALENELSAHTSRAALMEQVIQEVLHAVRNVMEGLTPCSKDSGCLAQTLQHFSQRVGNLYGVHCVCDVDDPDICIDLDVANQLCLITQEAVLNAVKHASASQIRLCLKKHDHSLSISIEDNGIGISSKRLKTGFGVMIMRDRAALIGASLDVFSNENGGTTVSCVWSFPEASIAEKDTDPMTHDSSLKNWGC